MPDSTGSPLAPLAGPLALGAGGLFAAVHVGLFVVADRTDIAAMLANPTFRFFNIAYAVTFWALMIALVALHARQAREAGTFGVFGLGAAIVGTMALGADMWFEAFASPWILGVAPELLTAEKAPLWQAGYLSSYVLFALGWALFGLACLRAQVMPTAVSAAVVVGGLAGFFAAMPPFGAPLGLAVAAAGAWLVRAARRPSVVVSAA
jgi:hypothetical protein